MSWLRIDDGFGDHPKVVDASVEAIGLWTLAGTWCARWGTDGKVASGQLRRLVGERWQTLAAELVATGLWMANADGSFQFHDWADYNPIGGRRASRRSPQAPSAPKPPESSLSDLSEKRRAAGLAGAAKRWGAKASAATTPMANADSNLPSVLPSDGSRARACVPLSPLPKGEEEGREECHSTSDGNIPGGSSVAIGGSAETPGPGTAAPPSRPADVLQSDRAPTRSPVVADDSGEHPVAPPGGAAIEHQGPVGSWPSASPLPSTTTPPPPAPRAKPSFETERSESLAMRLEMEPGELRSRIDGMLQLLLKESDGHIQTQAPARVVLDFGAAVLEARYSDEQLRSLARFVREGELTRVFNGRRTFDLSFFLARDGAFLSEFVTKASDWRRARTETRASQAPEQERRPVGPPAPVPAELYAILEARKKAAAAQKSVDARPNFLKFPPVDPEQEAAARAELEDAKAYRKAAREAREASQAGSK